jgi:hypothetical protein
LKKKIFILALAFASAANGFSQKQEVYMLGPMLHFNINDKKLHTSFGVELSYWNYNHFPYSVDGALEFEKKKVRLYSEFQTGIGILGFSLGPVLEFNGNTHHVKLGTQGSLWANYIGGFDMRLRLIDKQSWLCPGIYFKIPLAFGEYSSHSHHSDWDWDD